MPQQDGMEYRFGTSGEREVTAVLNDLAKLFVKLNKTVSEYDKKAKSSKTTIDGWTKDSERLIKTYEEVNDELKITTKVINKYNDRVSKVTNALKHNKAVQDTLNNSNEQAIKKLNLLSKAEEKAQKKKRTAAQAKAEIALDKANYKTKTKLAKQASDAEVRAKKETAARLKSINNAIVKNDKNSYKTKQKLAKQEAKARERIETNKKNKINAINEAIESDVKEAFKTERNLAKRTAKERAALEKTKYKHAFNTSKSVLRNAEASQIATQKTNKSVQELTLSWKSMARVMTVQLAHRALSLVTTKIREAMEAFIELEKRIGEIRTISQEASIAQETWTNRLLELSDAFGLDVVDQAEAAYQALSNQVVQGAKAIDFLRSANELAITTNSQTSESVNALSSVINAFGLSVYETDKIAASLFKTIELGRVRLSEMAEDLGTVSKLAAQLGLSYNDLFAIIDTLTIQGVEFAKANTQIRGIMIKLLKPTTEMKGLLQDLGVSSGEAAVQAYGFWGLMKELQKVTKGSSTEIAKYINRIRGLSGALTLQNEGLELAQRNVKQSEEAWESYQKAIEIAMTTTGKEIEIELNKVRNFFVEEFGKSLLTTINEITKSLGGLSAVVETTTKLFISLIPGVVVGRLASFVKQLAAARAAATSAAGAMAGFKAVMAGLTPMLIGLSVAGLIEILRRQEEARQEYLDDLEKDFTSTIEELNKEMSTSFEKASKGMRDNLKDVTKVYTRAIAEQRKVLYDWASDYESEIIEANEAIENSFDDLFKEISKVLKESRKDVKKYEKAFTDAQESIKDLKDDVAEFGFELAISGESPEAQLTILQNEADRLRQRAIKAIDELDQKALESVQKRVREIFKRRLELEEEIAGEAFLITSKSQAQREYNDLIDQQIKAQKEIIKLSEQEYEIKKQRLLFQDIFVDQFKDAYDEYTKLTDLTRKDFETAENYIKHLKERIQATSRLLGLVETKQFQDLGLKFDTKTVEKQLNDTLELVKIETIENEKEIQKRKFDERKKAFEQERKQLETNLDKQQEQLEKFGERAGRIVKGIGISIENAATLHPFYSDLETVTFANLDKAIEIAEHGDLSLNRILKTTGDLSEEFINLTANWDDWTGFFDKPEIYKKHIKSLARLQSVLILASESLEKEKYEDFSLQVQSASIEASYLYDVLDKIEKQQPLSDKLDSFKTLLKDLVNMSEGSKLVTKTIGETALEVEETSARIKELQEKIKKFNKVGKDSVAFLSNEKNIIEALNDELEELQKSNETLIEIDEERAKAQKDLKDEIVKSNKAIEISTRKQVTNIEKLIDKTRENTVLRKAMFESYRQNILKGGSLLVEQIKNSLDVLTEEVEEAWDKLRSIQEANLSRLAEVNEKLFKYAQQERTPEEQASALIQRITSLREKSFAAEEFERFEELRKEIDKLFDDYVQLAETEPTVQEIDAVDEYKRLAEEEFKIRKKFEEQAKEELQARKEKLKDEQERLNKIEETLKRIQNIDIEKLVQLPTDAAINSFKGLVSEIHRLDEEGFIDSGIINKTIQELLKLKDEAFVPIIYFVEDLAKTIQDVAESTERIRKNLLAVSKNYENAPRHADGGKVDDTLARVTKGEFIVNTEASDKFYSQLLAMNSYKGGQPAQPQTNVGDVNINYRSSGNQQVDILKIGKGLQKAIKQGVLTL